MFRTFTRTWWRDNPTYPGGLEPCAGRKRYLYTFKTQKEARDYAMSWNRIQGPERTKRQVRLSLKCEFEAI